MDGRPEGTGKETGEYGILREKSQDSLHLNNMYI
jgi:hypothetical protein